MIRYFLYVLVLGCAMLLGACGGGGGFSNSGGTSSAANALAVTVDAGPPLQLAAGYGSVNALFTSIKICTPGSSTACQTVDHILVDTGSIGLQLLADALATTTGTPSTAVPTAMMDPGTSAPLRKCVQFADGYSWGSLKVADVNIGKRWLTNLPINVIGDAAAGTAPADCSGAGTSPLPSDNTVVEFGANGVLGIGNFLQDCGSYCETNAPPASYYVCPGSGCTPTTVALANQLQNPIGALTDGDNNGVMLSLPAVAAPGQTVLNGTIYFGIETQTNNALNSASLYTLDGYGLLTTLYGTSTLSQSFIDSGSNVLFFDSSITQCTSGYAIGLYCPGGDTTTTENITQTSAQIQSADAATIATIDFAVGNANYLYNITPQLSVMPNLAAPLSSIASPISNSFGWGLPFFYGRKVYVLFENNTVASVTGPAVGF